MPTEEELRARVRMGAKFLDEWKTGWVKKITRAISVGNTKDCPLAQIYERYRVGIHILHLTDQDALLLGFRADLSEVGQNLAAFKACYKLLSKFWEEEVAKRK